MEFHTFEEKFQSIMEKWFTDTNNSMEEFYNKQQNAIDEGLELIFSDLRSSLNSNDPDSYPNEIVSFDSSSNAHPELTENLKFSTLETEPFQFSTLEVDFSSSIKLPSNHHPVEEEKSTGIAQFQTEQQLQQGKTNEKLMLLLEFRALIYDTGQINYGGRNAPFERPIDEKSDFQEKWDSISTDTGQIYPQIDKKLDNIFDIFGLIDINRCIDVGNGKCGLIDGEIQSFGITFCPNSLVSKLGSYEIVGTNEYFVISNEIFGKVWDDFAYRDAPGTVALYVFGKLCFYLRASHRLILENLVQLMSCWQVFSDVKRLSLSKGVHFYCRSCSTRLTTSLIRDFVEMPSANWRESADNWFGGCCCSFGGASEKPVDRYANAYTSTKGVCLLNSTAITLCKDDLLGDKFADDLDGIRRSEQEKDFSGINNLRKKRVKDLDTICDNGSGDSEALENIASRLGCCHLTHPAQYYVKSSLNKGSQHGLADLKSTKDIESLVNRRSLLNGILGDVFMAKSYKHSIDIEWKQFVCPQCSTLLGVYPCIDGKLPIDDGVRLFKCYLSTSLPVSSADDLFRQYTWEKMFANMLMESAQEELSFRTVVKDLTTKTLMLQVVLVNPGSWCCSSSSSGSEGPESSEPVSKSELRPAIKYLFSDCSEKISPLRVFEDWSKNNVAVEVFMLPFLVERLVKTVTWGMVALKKQYIGELQKQQVSLGLLITTMRGKNLTRKFPSLMKDLETATWEFGFDVT